MTYEEIMSITPGDIVPGGCSINPNAVYKGAGEPILSSDGSVASGGHSVSTNDSIVVLDIGYSSQLVLIQFPVGGGNYRQGYIVNSLENIQYYDVEGNMWTNGSSSETVYLSYTGNGVLGTLDPHETCIFLYKVGDRYNIVYDTSKGPYTKSGFVDYAGGITAGVLEGKVINGGGSSTGNITAGGIVPGGRTYPANAVVKFDTLYVRDENNNILPGRAISINDEITVIDISYSKQLALVQYPSGGDIRQGYVTNNTKVINYINPYQWVNGSSTEAVYLDLGCTKQFGTISAYESATLLYEKDGVYCVAYDSPGNNGGVDMLNKCGFVRFAGNKPQATPSAGELLYQGFPGNVEKISYGTSPAGYPLNVYKIGNGSNVLFANFAIHGFEDDWNHDGTALVHIANNLIRKISATSDLHGWTVYINNCANPDGTFNGISMDGPGRCTVSTRIDMNRCFPYNFSPMSNTRNFTGGSALGAPEARALHDIVLKINNEKISSSNQMVVIDFHGWMGMTQGNPSIGQYFNDKFGYGSTIVQYSAGFFSAWAQASLKNTKGLLVEYPKNTRSIEQCDNDDYLGKTYRGIMELLSSNSGSSSGEDGNTPSTGDKPYNAKGTVINVTTVLNVRKTPSTSATVVGTLKGGQPVTIVAKNGAWYKISSPITGYVHSDYINIIDSGNEGDNNSGNIDKVLNDEQLKKDYLSILKNIGCNPNFGINKDIYSKVVVYEDNAFYVRGEVIPNISFGGSSYVYSPTIKVKNKKVDITNDIYSNLNIGPNTLFSSVNFNEGKAKLNNVGVMLGNGTISLAFSGTGFELKINKTYKSDNQEVAYTNSLVLTVDLLPDSHSLESSMPQISAVWKERSTDFIKTMKEASLVLKNINMNKWVLDDRKTIAMFVGIVIVFTIGQEVLAAGVVGGLIGGIMKFSPLLSSITLTRGK